MAEISYPNSYSAAGVWLLDKEALNKFDQIIDSFWERFTEERRKAIDSEFRKKARAYFKDPFYATWDKDKKKEKLKDLRKDAALYPPLSRNVRKLEVEWESAKSITVERFSDVEYHPEAHHETPVGFEMELKCGHNSVTVTLDKSAHTGIKIVSHPATSGTALECHSALRQWARENEQPFLVGLWSSLSHFQWVVWWGLTLLLLTWSVSQATPPAREQFKSEARELLKDGLQPGEQQRGVELLLALQSDYDPNPPPPKSHFERIPVWRWAAIGAGFILCAIGSYPPRTTIGIGKGTDHVAWWLWWIRLNLYTVPSVLSSVVIVPMATNVVMGML